MSPAKCAVIEHPFGDGPTCCLAHGSASAFICTVHAMLYLMSKVVAAGAAADGTEPMLGRCMLMLLHFQILSNHV